MTAPDTPEAVGLDTQAWLAAVLGRLEESLTAEIDGHRYEYPECVKCGLLISMMPDDDPLPRHLADVVIAHVAEALAPIIAAERAAPSHEGSQGEGGEE